MRWIEPFLWFACGSGSCRTMQISLHDGVVNQLAYKDNIERICTLDLTQSNKMCSLMKLFGSVHCYNGVNIVLLQFFIAECLINMRQLIVQCSQVTFV